MRAAVANHLPELLSRLEPAGRRRIPPLPPPWPWEVPPLDTVDPKRTMAEAVAAGSKWRYEHLKELAAKGAKDVLDYEAQVLQLIATAASKLTAAEQMLTPNLIAAVQQIQHDVSDVSDLASSDAVKDVIGDLSTALSTQLLLVELGAWLLQNDAISFWIGLFSALLGDIAGFDTGLGDTRTYIHEQFRNPLAGLATAAVDRIRAKLADEVDRVIKPLRSAVESVTKGTGEAIREVFDSFDLPLTAGIPEIAGGADVRNVDPLAATLQKLSGQVDALEQTIRSAIEDVLQKALDGPSSLFEDLMITFYVLPILALLVIGLAGGPFSAAVLAAIVLVAAEELIHPIIGWLTGPLTGLVDDAIKDVTEIVGRLQRLFNGLATKLLANDPADYLKALSFQLRNIKDVLPEAFLDDAAEVLEGARDFLLDNALRIARGAEYAVGRENATAFDVIGLDYSSHITPAPEMPSGGDPRLLSGASLLRDLGTLDKHRTAITDGKEIEITHRLSLVDKLGSLTELKASGLSAIDASPACIAR
jgi:hypothetical protein